MTLVDAWDISMVEQKVDCSAMSMVASMAATKGVWKVHMTVVSWASN